jgi:hypothetical protein
LTTLFLSVQKIPTKPIYLKVERNRIFAWLPLSTSTLITSHLSSSLKVIETGGHLVLKIGPSTAT